MSEENNIDWFNRKGVGVPNKTPTLPDKTIVFTEDQKVAIQGLIEFIDGDFNNANHMVGLVGAGGVGKTFVTNYIITHCKYSPSMIRCTSTTHKACRVFSEAIGNEKVYTIQSTFGLRLNLNLDNFDPKNPQFDPTASPKLDNIAVLIIDEASMLTAGLVTYIYNKTKSLGIKVIMIGDDKQLAPVNERKSIAFSRCRKTFQLTTIVRQDKVNPIREILGLIRTDVSHKTYKFIEFVSKNIGLNKINDDGEGFYICRSDEFANVIEKSFKDEEYTKNIDMYRIVAYTNAKVSYWNTFVRNRIVQSADKNIITKHDLFMCYETIVDDFNDVVMNNSEEYIIHDLADFVDPKYSFKGFLVRFQKVHGGKVTAPTFIIDPNDNYTINMYHKTISNLIQTAKSATGGTRSAKWKAYYTFKRKYLLPTNVISKNGTILYTRDIDYGFAITSHKSQGSTYDNVFVDLNDVLYDKNGRAYADVDDLLRRIYVACSRARKRLVICYG